MGGWAGNEGGGRIILRGKKRVAGRGWRFSFPILAKKITLYLKEYT